MSQETPNFSPLSDDQTAALTEEQKVVYIQLDEQDRQFYADNFSPESLGAALERKGNLMSSRNHVAAFDQKVKAGFQADIESAEQPGISAADLGLGAAGVAGAVGMGLLAKQIAPDGEASWRGVEPRDLVNPLVREFARQEKTDIRFDPPTPEGVQAAAVLLRTTSGLVPGLTVVLTPLDESTQVKISKLSSEGLMQTIKESGLKLIDLVQDGLRSKRSGDIIDLLGLAGRAVDEGVDIAQMAKDLDLEDRAWKAIKEAADPLQDIYDEEMKIESMKRLKLELQWDDYYNCPNCRVAFGADDLECRVCGTARPDKPGLPDPRKNN